MAINIIDNREHATEVAPQYLTVDYFEHGATFYASFTPEAKWGSSLFLCSCGVVIRLDEPGNVWLPGGFLLCDEEGEEYCDDSRELQFYNVVRVELDILVAADEVPF